jgi:hypothetical protein
MLALAAYLAIKEMHGLAPKCALRSQLSKRKAKKIFDNNLTCDIQNSRQGALSTFKASGT